MDIRLGPQNLADALPTLLRTVSSERSKGTISEGEYHLYRDHLWSRDIHAVRRVNQQLLAARARGTAPKQVLAHLHSQQPFLTLQQVVAKMAQLPRDPATNRSSFGNVLVQLWI